MSLSPEWDALYAGGYAVNGTEPTFNKLIVSFATQADNILELGAGTGDNIPFLAAKYGANSYHGIEGSAAAVAAIRKTWPSIGNRIHCGDFTREQPFARNFDLIVERASIAHNDTAAIARCLALVYEALKPGGIFVSSDWFSIRHSEYDRGDMVDAGTRTGYTDGQFVNIGNVHFSSEAELRTLFYRFERIHLVERETRRVPPGVFIDRVIDRKWISPAFAAVDYRSSVWDIVCRKPK